MTTTAEIPMWQDAATLAERHDPTRVLPYVDAYWQRRAELNAAGRYPYHTEFYDLPGIAGCARPESPVYVLAGLYQRVAGEDAEAALVADGYRLTRSFRAEQATRYAHVVIFDWHYSGEGAHVRSEYHDARIMGGTDGAPKFLLPKGRRTHGRHLSDSLHIYVKDER